MVEVYQIDNLSCLQACIASITGLDQVPKVNHNNNDSWFTEYNSELIKYGYELIRMNKDPLLDEFYIKCDIYLWIYKDREELSGHAVVVNKDGLRHNPSSLSHLIEDYRSEKDLEGYIKAVYMYSNFIIIRKI